MHRRSVSLLVFLVAAAVACGDADQAPEEVAAINPDSLSPEEVANLWPDPTRYPEMRDGRMDTVDMRGESPGAEWHVQVVNYTDTHIAMTYAFSNTGPDTVSFAADGQPRIVDDLGNVYSGLVVPENPRLEIETGASGMGVYLFTPQVATGAQTLTLYVNDSTAPVIRVGPWGLYHTPPEEEEEEEGAGMNLQAGD
jgi:hypothetical protein